MTNKVKFCIPKIEYNLPSANDMLAFHTKYSSQWNTLIKNSDFLKYLLTDISEAEKIAKLILNNGN